jgi:hypothetical protein
VKRLVLLALALLPMLAAAAHALREERQRLVEFQSAPFPYNNLIPDRGQPFLDVTDGERRGHTSARGGIYWQDPTYADRRVLLYLPAGFDPARAAVMVVYFHGNASTLERDVDARQRLPAQLAASGVNAVLVAPQFAVDALDSSAGRFWQPGAFASFIDEAGHQLAALCACQAAHAMARLPVVLVAYSGGYLPAAWSLAVGGAQHRIRGLVLLDALYGEQDRYFQWILHRPRNSFVFSAYGDSTRDGNQALQGRLAEAGIRYSLGTHPRFAGGAVSFVDAGPNVQHADFVTRAWVVDPVSWILRRIDGVVRR